MDNPIERRKKYLRDYQRNWVRQRRAAWIEKNGPCQKCGSTERLEVDHVDPSKKKINPRSLWSLSPVNPLRVAELAKCQVLCNACHEDKTRLQLQTEPVHGTLSRYNGRYRCRCVLCRAANAEYRRKYRADRKRE